MNQWNVVLIRKENSNTRKDEGSFSCNKNKEGKQDYKIPAKTTKRFLYTNNQPIYNQSKFQNKHYQTPQPKGGRKPHTIKMEQDESNITQIRKTSNRPAKLGL